MRSIAPFRPLVSTTKRAMLATASATVIAMLALPSSAQTCPTRPVRWIVPLCAGGGADIGARTIAQRLTDRLGQQIIIENRGGGGTLIGSAIAPRATPDGYTLFLGTATTHGINSSLIKKLPYDPVQDFVPVSLVATLPLVLVTHPGVAAQNVGELVALAKTTPGQMFFASAGNGSSSQRAGVRPA